MSKRRKTTSSDIPLFDIDRVPAPADEPPRASRRRSRGTQEEIVRPTERLPPPPAPAEATAEVEAAGEDAPAGNDDELSNNGTANHPLTVTQLARGIGDVLDTCFARVWVVGQVSGLKRPASGHLYFDLKDENSCLSCVMWREQASQLRDLADGQDVLACGRVGFFGRSGRLQLYLTRVEPRGIGALEIRFRQLKEKLEKEGLFAAERKKPLPWFPQTVGVVTSSSGAAVRDIFHVLGRRAPWLRVLLYPVSVQGPAAAGEIARAIRDFDRHPGDEVDVLIVGRGGGSAEDLWAFNEEVVARAIAECGIPVVSAVGHETDFSISDFVADRRAPTPSAAAEIVVPDRDELLARLRADASRLSRGLAHAVNVARSTLELLAGHRFFKYPEEIAGERSAAVDDLSSRMAAALAAMTGARHRQLHEMERRLLSVRPEARLARQRGRLATAEARHAAAFARLVERRGAMLERLSERLEALGPLGVLSRGYSITVSARTGRPVRSASEVAAGETLETTVASRETIRSRVEEEHRQSERKAHG